MLTTAFAQRSESKAKVGIVMSGGGALGFAHIGVLQALEDNGIYPTVVAGTSMGALVGALYANGMRPMEIFEMVRREQLDKLSSFIDLSFSNSKNMGLSSHEHTRSILEKYLPHDSFDELKMPFYLCATNVSDGRMVIKGEGDTLIAYLMGSSSIPGVFEPVEINGKLHIDGGVYNNLPAQPIRDKCVTLIGVDVNSEASRSPVKTTKDVVFRALTLLIYENTRPGRKLCNYVIDVPVNYNYGLMDFKKFYSIYQVGYSTGLKYVKEHPDLVRKASR